jgi:hypothetical protein
MSLQSRFDCYTAELAKITGLPILVAKEEHLISEIKKLKKAEEKLAEDQRELSATANASPFLLKQHRDRSTGRP